MEVTYDNLRGVSNKKTEAFSTMYFFTDLAAFLYWSQDLFLNRSFDHWNICQAIKRAMFGATVFLLWVIRN